MTSQLLTDALAVEETAWNEWMAYVQASQALLAAHKSEVDAGNTAHAATMHRSLTILTEKHNDAYARLQDAQTVTRKLWALETRPYYASYEI